MDTIVGFLDFTDGNPFGVDLFHYPIPKYPVFRGSFFLFFHFVECSIPILERVRGKRRGKGEKRGHLHSIRNSIEVPVSIIRPDHQAINVKQETV